MKSTLAIPMLLATTALFPLGGYAAQGVVPTPDSTTTLAAPAAQDSAAAKDQSIPAKIKAEMAAQHVASLPEINIDSDASGVVVLTGRALSQEDVDTTMSIARSTPGVTAVKNGLKVKPKD